MWRYVYGTVVLFWAALSALAQQNIPSQRAQPGSTQDWSAAGITKPMRTGTTLPSTCTVGTLFFKSDATAGQNIYACTSANTWTLQSGGGGGVVAASGRIACTPITAAGVTAIDWDTALSGTSPCNFMEMTTGASNITLSMSGGGADLLIEIIQGGTARTITLAGNMTGWASASTVAGSDTFQYIAYDGTTYKGTDVVSTDPSVSNFVSSTTGNDTYAGTLTGPLAALTNGVRVILKADTANTGAATLNVTGAGGSALGAVSILDAKGASLTDSCIVANEPVPLTYNSTGPAWIMDRECAASTTVPAGATGYLFGQPSFTNTNTSGMFVAYSGNANSGSTFPWVANSTAIKTIGYEVLTASGAGNGLMIGIYAVNSTTGLATGSPLCSLNASGTNVTATGWKAVAVSAGSLFSGGTCTGFVIGGAYMAAISSSDAGVLIILKYGDPANVGLNSIHSAVFSYYDGMTSGSGGAMSLVAVGSWALGGALATAQGPIFTFGN